MGIRIKRKENPELHTDYSTVEELASAKKIDVSHVRRIFRLNPLAPDIVEAILRDEDPNHISLRTLYRGIAPS